MGGDEICVILPKTDVVDNDYVIESLDKIEKAVAVASIELKLELSVAFGYSNTSESKNGNIYQAYRESDRCMYERKQKMKSKFGGQDKETAAI
ncbi:MAG: diguanylate cyclase [Lachnospiraceae bacterium]|nr:diguanylate cyclase [Lachnospiraceae bacterium]